MVESSEIELNLTELWNLIELYAISYLFIMLQIR